MFYAGSNPAEGANTVVMANMETRNKMIESSYCDEDVKVVLDGMLDPTTGTTIDKVLLNLSIILAERAAKNRATWPNKTSTYEGLERQVEILRECLKNTSDLGKDLVEASKLELAKYAEDVKLARERMDEEWTKKETEYKIEQERLNEEHEKKQVEAMKAANEGGIYVLLRKKTKAKIVPSADLPTNLIKVDDITFTTGQEDFYVLIDQSDDYAMNDIDIISVTGGIDGETE